MCTNISANLTVPSPPSWYLANKPAVIYRSAHPHSCASRPTCGGCHLGRLFRRRVHRFSPPRHTDLLYFAEIILSPRPYVSSTPPPPLTTVTASPDTLEISLSVRSFIRLSPRTALRNSRRVRRCLLVHVYLLASMTVESFLSPCLVILSSSGFHEGKCLLLFSFFTVNFRDLDFSSALFFARIE